MLDLRGTQAAAGGTTSATMCLILLAVAHHPAYPLVVAANRDERHDRPSAVAAYWDDAPQVLAGRDLEAGGTWLGIDRSGRFAAVTNFRQPGAARSGRESRGRLVADYLRGDTRPLAYLRRVRAERDRYDGFSLLLGDVSTLYYYCNREDAAPRRLAPGIYGLGNGRLDEDWPKVTYGKRALAALLESAPPLATEDLLAILADGRQSPGIDLPDTGGRRPAELHLAPLFITGAEYGTRCSTALVIGRSGRVEFLERSFDGQARAVATARHRFELAAVNPHHS